MNANKSTLSKSNHIQKQFLRSNENAKTVKLPEKTNNELTSKVTGVKLELDLNSDIMSNKSSKDDLLVTATPKKKTKINNNERCLFNGSSYEFEESEHSEHNQFTKKKREMKNLVNDTFYPDDRFQTNDEVEKLGVSKLADKTLAKIAKKIGKKTLDKTLPQKFKNISKKVDLKMSGVRELIENTYSNKEYKFELMYDTKEIAKVAEEIKNKKIFDISKDWKVKKKISFNKNIQKSKYTKNNTVTYGRTKNVK